MDYVANGQSRGSVANQLLANGFDVAALRPYYDSRGRSCITQNVNGTKRKMLTQNAGAASLLIREWQLLDTTVIKTSLNRLRAVADLRGRGLELTIPNGMSKTVLQSQNMSDVNPAAISMDPLADSAEDRPVFGIDNLPLPIIHKDFSFSAREIAVSRNGSMPLDTTGAELAARKVAEGFEQLLLGVAPTYKYGGGAVYGYTNFPGRLTFTLNSPLASGWTPQKFIANVLSMRYLCQQHLHFGPWVIYTSLAWDQFLDNDLNGASANASNITLRQRLRDIEGIQDVVTLDYLPGYDIVMVQMSTDVVREVVGMDITTIQWESHGGLNLHFKVMGMLVPQLRTDNNGNSGIVHGTVSGQTFKPTGAVYLPLGNP